MRSWTVLLLATVAGAGASFALACGSFGEADAPGADAADDGGPVGPDAGNGAPGDGASAESGEAGASQPCGDRPCGVACLAGDTLTILASRDLKDRNDGPFVPMGEGMIEDAVGDEDDATSVKDVSGGNQPEGLRFAKHTLDVGGKTIVRVVVVARARAAVTVPAGAIVAGIYNPAEDDTANHHGFEGKWSSSTAQTVLGVEYQNVSRAWSTFPWGELPWTESRVNTIQLMLSLHSGTTNPVEVTRVWLEVCSR